MAVCKVVKFNTQISQGSAATDFRLGGTFLLLQFLYECKSERIIKIDPHLPHKKFSSNENTELNGSFSMIFIG